MMQSLADLKFVPTKTVLMSKVIFDGNNPNTMSEDKHEAFDKVITRWGFAKDPWLNENDDGTYNPDFGQGDQCVALGSYSGLNSQGSGRNHNN